MCIFNTRNATGNQYNTQRERTNTHSIPPSTLPLYLKRDNLSTRVIDEITPEYDCIASSLSAKQSQQLLLFCFLFTLTLPIHFKSRTNHFSCAHVFSLSLSAIYFHSLHFWAIFDPPCRFRRVRERARARIQQIRQKTNEEEKSCRRRRPSNADKNTTHTNLLLLWIENNRYSNGHKNNVKIHTHQQSNNSKCIWSNVQNERKQKTTKN